MIIDSMLQVSKDQALTGTSLVRSTSHIDLGHTALIGPGDPLWWVIIAKIGLAGTSPTLAISVRTDTVTGFGSVETLLTMPALSAAQFATGQKIVIPMTWKNSRFLELGYTMGGTSPTCTVDAFLTSQHPESWKAFPDGI